MSTYAEERGILHEAQEGFRCHRNTERQLQLLLALLEDAKIAKKDIYLLYIDFTNAFGSVDHPRLIHILGLLGFPPDCIDIIQDIYADTRTAFITPAGTTQEIPLRRGNIQGDALSPLIFLCFMEPLLRWLEHDHRDMYNCSLSEGKAGAAAYADDLVIPANSITQLKRQRWKMEQYQDWGMLEINIPKCGLTAAMHETGKGKQKDTETLHCMATHMKHKGETLPILASNEPYKYLGIMVTADLTWKHQKRAIAKKIKSNTKTLMGSWARDSQKARSMQQVICAQARYGMAAAPYSPADILGLQTVIHAAIKKAMHLPRETPTHHLYNNKTSFGVGLQHMLEQYNNKLVESLHECLKDNGRIGTITTSIAKHYHKHGIKERRWTHMGPTARKLTVAWQAGLSIGGDIQKRPNVIERTKGKMIDNGWDWGILTELQESDVTPLIDIGIDDLEDITTGDGTHIVGTRSFTLQHPKAKQKHIRALHKIREGICEYTHDPDKPARIKDAAGCIKPSASPWSADWPTETEQQPIRVTRTRKAKKRKKPTTAAVDDRIHPEGEPAKQIHRAKRVGNKLLYEVEWEDSWTDGRNVAPNKHHSITEGRDSKHDWEIEQVLETTTTITGKKYYKVKWARTWESPEDLLPPGMQTSKLIGDYYNEKLQLLTTPREQMDRKATTVHENDDGDTEETETRKVTVQITTEDVNPDTDIHPTGKYTLSITEQNGIKLVLVHSPQGALTGQLTEERTLQLWNRYKMAKARGQHTEADGPFPEELHKLLKRYKTGHRGDSSATGKVKMTNHWTLPDEYMKVIHDLTDGATERFASPLNVHPETTDYYTAFASDRVFGARHNAYSVAFTGAGEVNPECTRERSSTKQ